MEDNELLLSAIGQNDKSLVSQLARDSSRANPLTDQMQNTLQSNT